VREVERLGSVIEPGVGRGKEERQSARERPWSAKIGERRSRESTGRES